MNDKIGPTFSAELSAAGVSLNGIGWDQASGVIACTDAGQLAAAQAVLAKHDPTKALPVTTVTGNQWAFALSNLGLSAAWQVGVTKSKSSDQVRAGLIARDTPLVATDPLLARVATNAGNDASGNPLIVVATVFTIGQGMPL